MGVLFYLLNYLQAIDLTSLTALMQNKRIPDGDQKAGRFSIRWLKLLRETRVLTKCIVFV